MHRCKVLIGIGSNIGDRKSSIIKAIGELKFCNVEKISAVYETSPIGYSDQPDFYNLCLTAVTDIMPFAFLSLLKNIEHKMGRTNGIRWGPRIIDLDILLFDDKLIFSKTLIVPHIEMLNRRFVLEPSIEIAGDWIVPGTKSVEALYRERREVLELQTMKIVAGTFIDSECL